MVKKVFFLLLIVIIGGLLVWLIFETTRNEVLPTGANLPSIEYETQNGIKILKTQNRPILVVFFNPICEHCQYELNTFNEQITSFSETDLYFLTSKADFFFNNITNHWENLKSASNVRFGIVNIDNFKRFFGSTALPSLFFFSETGKLVDKIRGEIKIEKVLELQKDLKSDQAQNGG